MNFTDEKDYIMRMIKETIRVLFVVAFGEKYVSVELENKYEVSGKNLKDLQKRTMKKLLKLILNRYLLRWIFFPVI